ncbi:MAG: extracellular solute-binding protein [Clostridiales bacterium]|nr:extracellular solute-binding protein [Clostridiales bacterium]
MKKVLSILLVLSLLVSLPLLTAVAAEEPIPLFGTGSSPEDPLFDPALGLTLTVYTTNGWGEDSKPDNTLVKEYIEAHTGLTLNFVYTAIDNFVEKMNLVFVSGEAYDVVSDGSGLIVATRPLQSLYDDGLIIDLTPYMDTYGKNVTKYLGEGYDYTRGTNGELLSIAKRVSNNRGNTPTIRADWVEQAGLSGLPTTIKELETYFEYVKNNDCNGNGDATDEIPYLPSNWLNLGNCMEGIFLGKDGIGKNYLGEDGNVYRDINHPLYMSFLDTLRSWYEKGYLYPEFFTVTSSQVNDLVSADRAGLLNQWYSGQVRPFQAVEEADTTKHYELLPNIESPNEGVQTTYSEGTPYQPSVLVSTTSEHPEVGIAYFDWMLSDPTINASIWNGIEGLHWEWFDEEELTFTTLPGGEERYFKGFQAVCQWDAKDQFIYANPADYISIKYDHYLNILNSGETDYYEAFDLKVPYVKVGTDLEFMSNDAETLLEESIISYIIGTIDRDAMTSAVTEYNAIYGDVYSKVYTEQYNTWLANR